MTKHKPKKSAIKRIAKRILVRKQLNKVYREFALALKAIVAETHLINRWP